MGWREAGDAWGSRATEWAYLAEPHFRPVNERIFGLTGVKAGTALLDVGCGSGYASWLAADRGAGVHGLDASENLLTVARARTPHGDFRFGDMDSLPWDMESFDVVTCFNSIWIGNDVAMAEAARVLRRGGNFAMTFWGSPKRMGLAPFFQTVAALSPSEHGTATIGLGDTGRSGVAEAMIERAGLTFLERGSVTVTNEFPDLELGMRALLAAGPAYPAIANVGEQRFVAALREAFSGLPIGPAGLRISSDIDWVTARKP